MQHCEKIRKTRQIKYFPSLMNCYKMNASEYDSLYITMKDNNSCTIGDIIGNKKYDRIL